MKKQDLFYTDAEHPSKLQQGVGVLGIPTKEQIRQIAMPQQEEKTATTCCRIICQESEKAKHRMQMNINDKNAESAKIPDKQLAVYK